MRRLCFSLSVAIALGLGGNVAQATLVAQEDFESYAPGGLNTLNGGAGWSGAWTANGSTSVAAANLSYNAGSISIDGGTQAAQYLAPNNDVLVEASRQFPGQSSSTLYLSFLYQESVNPSGNHFFQTGFLNGAGNPTASVIDTGNQWTVRRGTSTNTGSGISTVTGETYFLILKLEDVVGDSDYDQLTLFVDPTSRDEGSNASTVTPTTDGLLDLSSTAFLNLRRAFFDSGDTVLVDEFRVGTTFASVLNPIPEPSTALLVTGLALVIVRRRRAA